METEAEQDAEPRLTIDGAVGVITLRRPGKANRIDETDVAVLRAHCASLRSASNTVRGVVLTAIGRHFSAGYDLRSLERSSQAPADDQRVDSFSQMIDEVGSLPQLTVCALNGGVFGGATELALACDFRLGVPSTRLRMPAARLGLHYPMNGLKRFVSRVGVQQAKRIFLLAEEFDAPALLAIGYLDAVVAGDQLLARALAIAQVAASHAPLAMTGMKASIDALADGTHASRASDEAIRACRESADFQEGVSAMIEKREPRFIGR